MQAIRKQSTKGMSELDLAREIRRLEREIDSTLRAVTMNQRHFLGAVRNRISSTSALLASFVTGFALRSVTRSLFRNGMHAATSSLYRSWVLPSFSTLVARFFKPSSRTAP